MNCQAPLPGDDDGPFRPDDAFLRTAAPEYGTCPDCQLEHRLDLGCPASERGKMRVVLWVAAIVGALLLAAACVSWRYA